MWKMRERGDTLVSVGSWDRGYWCRDLREKESPSFVGYVEFEFTLN
jgi:hypothetical protein